MSSKDSKLFHCANVKDTDSLIPRRASNQVAVWRPLEGLDSILMVMPADDRVIVELGQCYIPTHKVDSTVPVRGSQNLIILSLLPETSRPFVLCHSTHFTSQPCPNSEVRPRDK